VPTTLAAPAAQPNACSAAAAAPSVTEAGPQPPAAGAKRKAAALSEAPTEASPAKKRPTLDLSVVIEGGADTVQAASAGAAPAAAHAAAGAVPAAVAAGAEAAGGASGEAQAALALPPPVGHPMSPPPGKRTPRLRAPLTPNGPDGAPWPAQHLYPLGHHQQQGSDADYLAALSKQQQQQQHAKQGVPAGGHAAPPPHPSTMFAPAAAADPVYSPHQPGARPAGLRSPYLGMAAAAAAGAAALGALQDASGGATPAGLNPYLVGLPSRRGGLAGVGRRSSLGTELPQRLTPLAEAAPEPRQVPLHVAAAARDVMTGAARSCDRGLIACDRGLTKV
jgi:hypothetical protein